MRHYKLSATKNPYDTIIQLKRPLNKVSFMHSYTINIEESNSNYIYWTWI